MTSTETPKSPDSKEETYEAPTSTDPEEKKAIDAMLKEIGDMKLSKELETLQTEGGDNDDDDEDDKKSTSSSSSPASKAVEVGSDTEKLLGEAVMATLTRQNPKHAEDPDLNWLCVATLRYRKYDIKSATDRLGRYLDWRRKNDLLHQNIAKDTKTATQLKDRLIRLLPTKDKQGRAILLLNLRNHNPRKYTAAETVRCVHWVIKTALKNDIGVQQNGFVVINDLHGSSHQNLDINIPKTLLPMFTKIFPARVGGIYIINPNAIVQLMIPLYKKFSPKVASRVHIYGTQKEKLLRNFEKESIPEEVGGTLKFDFVVWLEDQIKLAGVSSK